jgi:hypothetical protein
MPGVNMVGVEGSIDAAAAHDGVGRAAALSQPGVGKRPWSRMPGWKDHLDFGEQFPYDPETAKALLKTPYFQAAWAHVPHDAHPPGTKLGFATTWLDKS